MQNMHRLILRQAKKYFGDIESIPEDLLPLLEAVSQSYTHYEGDRILIERAMELSSSELAESNKKLLDESKRQNLLIKSLKESLKSLSDDDTVMEDDDILKIADILQDEIHKRRQAEAAIKTSEEKYRGVIENMELGLIEMDLEGRIVSAYDQFCKMLGYNLGELLGRKLIDFVTDEGSRKILEEQEIKRKQGEFGVYEVQLRTSTSEIVWMIISGAPVFNQYREVSGSLAVHFDITHRKEIEAELKAARTKAEHSLKSKELFLANISHEIRTPMNAIIGMSRLLSSTILDTTQQDYLKAIRTSSDGLLVIINDVLDMSKIESGKFTTEEIPFDLRRLVTDLERALAYKAEEKGIFFETRVDDRLHDTHIGDPTRINQVMVNLVSNAVKFTESGGVTFEVNLAQSLAGKDAICFAVTDTGVGIEKDKLGTIFENFTQADETISRKFGGTGLGLAICKELVNIFGGQLEVESEPGKGSTFSFTITLDHGEKEHMATDAPIEDQLLDGCRVLLVEDNELNRFLAITILKKWNAVVDVANNGLIAVQKVKDNDYDIILMDMQMPELDGVGATKVIRNELNREVPIIALTANAIKGERDKCINAGMNDYVSKPFEPAELYGAIVRLTKGKLNKEEFLPMGDAPRFSLSKLKEIYRDNEEEMLETVQIFISQMRVDVEEISRKAAEGDREGVQDLAHKMRPNFELFQIKEVVEDMQFLELNARKVQSEEILDRVSKLEEVAKKISSDLKKIIPPNAA